MLKNFFNSIKNSIMSKGKESSTRIGAYVVLAIVVIFCIMFIGIELTTAFIALYTSGKYVLSNEIIIVFGSLLTHHLTLLGINKNYETKENIKQIESQTTITTANNSTTATTVQPVVDGNQNVSTQS